MSAERVVDLRSDTVTRPCAAMRRAMAEAEVGDDVLDGDPTTRRLQERIAELLGMEEALFFPSGIQANETAIWLVTEPGTELLADAQAHVIHYEMAGVAALTGVQIRPVQTADGRLTPALIRAAWRADSPYEPRISAINVENTHNLAGGRVLRPDDWDAIVACALDRSVPVHLDGARLWNAAAALRVSPSRLAQGATTVMVSLSKGLGCPIGSCLAGSGDTIGRAREMRRRLGGGMRQTGILAAAGLYAIQHHLAGLTDDHEHARLFAERLADHHAVHPVPPETNIVMLDMRHEDADAQRAARTLHQRGVLVVAMGPRRLRAVTHRDVSRADVEWAAERVADALQ